MGPGALNRLIHPGIRPLLLGLLFCTGGLLMYLVGVVMAVPRALFGLSGLLPLNEWIVWYSGVPIVVGIALLLSGIGFMILAILALGGSARAAEAADAQRPAPPVTG